MDLHIILAILDGLVILQGRLNPVKKVNSSSHPKRPANSKPYQPERAQTPKILNPEEKRLSEAQPDSKSRLRKIKILRNMVRGNAAT